MYTYNTRVNYVAARKGKLECGNGLNLIFSAPPEFGGLKGFATPEDLFVASVNTCLMLTFESICKKMNITFDFFECNGEGILENLDGKEVMTKIVLKAKVKGQDKQKLLKALKLAEEYCLIRNSIKSNVILEIDDQD